MNISDLGQTYTQTQEVVQVQIAIFESMIGDVAYGIEERIEEDEKNEREGCSSTEPFVGGK